MLASQVSLSFTSVINIEKEKMDTSLHNQAFSINQCHEWKGVFQRKQCTDMSDMMLKQKTLHFQGGPGKPLYS
jgi:DNA-binding XRE family transcriptional regulator